MEFGFSTASGKQSQARQDTPFVMQVLGDFGGNQRHAKDPGWLMQVPVRQVDLDNIDGLWLHFSPRLDIEIDDYPLTIEPRSLDDFHPDQLYKSLPVFEELRQLREKLQDPEHSAEAMAGIMSDNPDAIDTSARQSSETTSDAGSESGDDMMTRLLGNSQRPASRPQPQQSGLDQLLHKAVAAHIVQDADPRVESATTAVDSAIAETMRKILHHPEFQTLEGNWRSLYEFVYASELGEEIVLRVCSVTKQDLLAGLPQSADSMQECGLYQLLIGRDRRAADEEGFSMLFCNYFFGANSDDIALLATLGTLADLNDAAVIGAAESELIGSSALAMQPDFDSWATTDNSFWQQLRESPIANRIGLALPRILGRLPYGQSHEQVDGFEFEGRYVAEVVDVVPPRIACRHTEHLVIAAGLIDHLEHRDWSDLNEHTGKHRLGQ